VVFESHVVLSGETFNETGSIDYRGRGTVTFETVGVGHLGPSPVAGLQWGAVIWRIIAGAGEFVGSTSADGAGTRLPSGRRGSPPIKGHKPDSIASYVSLLSVVCLTQRW
jgi:hypothetical protein